MSGSYLENSNSKNTNNLNKCVEFCVKAWQLEAEETGKIITNLDKEIMEKSCKEDCEILLELLEEDEEFRKEMNDFIQKIFNKLSDKQN